MFDNFIIDNNRYIYVQLYEYLKNEILAGRLIVGNKLPSIRSLAKLLGLSTTTVENAYDQLNVEGYIYSLPQKGYYVSDIKSYTINSNSHYNYNKKIKKVDVKKPMYIDKSTFNVSIWKKYINKAINKFENKIYYYGDMQGEIELRKEICKNIYEYRGVLCYPEQIVIGAGVQVLSGIISNVLLDEGFKNIGFENPGFTELHHIYKGHGFNIIPIDVDNDGLKIKELMSKKIKVCFVTPSNQFPTSSLMPVTKRSELLEWANMNDGIIIEDDYDSYLRYTGQLIPSLQSLDINGRVIYLGSYSSILTPSTRISYMVLPNRLLKKYELIKYKYNQTVSTIEQLALALFIKDGELNKHIKKLRTLYNKKTTLIKKIIQNYYSNKLEIIGGDTGTNIIINVKSGDRKQIKNIIDRGKQRGIYLIVLNEFCTKDTKDEEKYKNLLLLKHRNIPIDLLKEIFYDVF